jgi:hypothetical protein
MDEDMPAAQFCLHAVEVREPRRCLLNLNRPTALAGLVRPYLELYIVAERPCGQISSSIAMPVNDGLHSPERWMLINARSARISCSSSSGLKPLRLPRWKMQSNRVIGMFAAAPCTTGHSRVGVVRTWPTPAGAGTHVASLKPPIRFSRIPVSGVYDSTPGRAWAWSSAGQKRPLHSAGLER